MKWVHPQLKNENPERKKHPTQKEYRGGPGKQGYARVPEMSMYEAPMSKSESPCNQTMRGSSR
jgi:hypothetical protein